MKSVILLGYYRYVFSYPGLFVLQTLRIPGSQTVHLRALNLSETLFGLYFAARSLSQLLLKQRGDTSKSAKTSTPQSLIDHTALNVALFPPLFFFSALYYTDVMSTVAVLHAYECFLGKDKGRMMMYSFMALSLRQTNIFWTAVWLGGLEVVAVLKAGNGSERRQKGGLERPRAWRKALGESWSSGTLYDPLVSEASFAGHYSCNTCKLHYTANDRCRLPDQWCLPRPGVCDSYISHPWRTATLHIYPT